MAFKDLNEAISEKDKTWLWKFILRLVNVGVCFIAVVLFIYPTIYDGSWLVWSYIPLGLSIIYAAITLPILVVRCRPVHPGFNVGFDLIFTIMFILTSLAAVAGAVWAIQDEATQSSYSDDCQGGYDSYGYYCDPVAYDPSDDYYTYPKAVGPVAAAGAAFEWLATILQFILFIAACIDTARYNRLHRVGEDVRVETRAREMFEMMMQHHPQYQPLDNAKAPEAADSETAPPAGEQQRSDEISPVHA